MNDLIPIGRFSQLTRLTAKALRFYDEEGLLKPVIVDEATGYRYYSLSQAAEAEKIRLLRSVDMPLDAIRTLLRTHNSEQVLEQLAYQRQRLEQRLREQQQALDVLARLTTDAFPSYEVRLKTVAEQPYLGYRTTCPPSEACAAVHTAQRQALEYLKRAEVRLTGPSIVMYHSPDDADVWDVEICQPIPAGAFLTPPGEAFLGQLPAATVAYTVHAGPYNGFDGLDAGYRALWSWIRQHGHETHGTAREVYLFHPDNTPDPDDYRVEIAWPIA